MRFPDDILCGSIRCGESGIGEEWSVSSISGFSPMEQLGLVLMVASIDCAVVFSLYTLVRIIRIFRGK